MKKLSIIVLFFVFVNTIDAQITFNQFGITHKSEYMLPSPEAISRIKSAARPVGEFTGIPDISLPLWANDYSSISIELNYHAQGIQVNEEASCVGLGWNLEAGGIIARIVRGLPDDYPQGYINLATIIKDTYEANLTGLGSASLEYLYDNNNIYDGTPDIFYYNFNGIKGKFVFNQSGDIASIPYNNLKITCSYDASGYIEEFIIITPDGMNYVFGQVENISVTSGPSYLGYSNFNSAWYLSSVKMLSGESLSYGYKTITENKLRGLYEYDMHTVSAIGEHINEDVSVDMTITRPRLDTIKDGCSEALLQYGDNNELEAIKIYAYDYTAQNKSQFKELYTVIDLEYSDFTLAESGIIQPDRTRRLDSIEVGTWNKKKYKFTYNSTPIPEINSKKQDLWGYYNNYGGSSLLPNLAFDDLNKTYEALNVTSVAVPGVSRPVNETYVIAGILTSVENPLGGVTEYEYESNKFLFKSSYLEGGGLRIKEIKYYGQNEDFSNPVSTTTYQYTGINGGTPSGISLSKPNFAYYADNPDYTTIPENTFRYASFACGLSNFHDNPVFYPEVTVDNNGLGYTVKEFTMPVANTTFYTDQIFETGQVTGFIGLDKDLTYTVDVSYADKDFASYFTYDWNNAYITSKVNYDNNKTILSEVNYNYLDIDSYQVISGFISGPDIYTAIESEIGGELDESRYRQKHKFYYCPSWKLLQGTTKNNYISGNLAFTSSMNLEYDGPTSDYRQQTKVEIIDANGKVYFKEISYPYHYVYNDAIATDIIEHEQDLYEAVFPKTSAYRTDYTYTTEEGTFTDYYINKKVSKTGITLPDVPSTVTSADKNREAIERMKARGMASVPVEVLEGIMIGGEKGYLKGALTLFKVLEIDGDDKDKISIDKDKELIMEGPIPETSFTPSYMGTEFMFHSAKYKTVNDYCTYSDNGELLEVIGADGIKTAFKWTGICNYMLAKAVNGSSSLISDYDGTTEDIRDNDAMITTYGYKILAGPKRVTGPRGRSNYYVYEKEGALVAFISHDMDIREVYASNAINSENVNYIDVSTVPGESPYFLTESPECYITFKNGIDESTDIYIDPINPAFEYYINYEDEDPPLPGEELWEQVTSSPVNHTFTQSESGKVTIRVMREGQVVWEESANDGVILNPK